ncbi:MAG: hypothetical protein K2X11_11080 [Acetobacteraceae bacterium]|nr:hypothetical protein [Acetobacteraceae bacterium]
MIRIAAAMTLVAATFAVPAQAAWTLNGLALNGVSLNGVRANGLALNGFRVNGLAINGVHSGATQVTVEGITLPAR